MYSSYALFITTLLSALICFFASNKLSRIVTILSSGFSVLLSLSLLGKLQLSSNLIYIDGLSKIMLITIAIIYLSTSIFSIGYFRHIKKPLLKQNHYWAFLNLFILSMFFSVTVNNLGLIWVGIEATTITSALLVAIDNDYPSIEASWRYIIIVSVGLIVSLVGIIFIYAQTHTLNITQMLSSDVEHNRLIVIGAAMAVIGFGTKAGIFPMHTWLPDVHGRSIAPVSAIFSSVLLPSALFGIIRISQIVAFQQIRDFMFILGLLTVIFASIFMVNQKYYKRMFAYSSIENMGVVLVGISLGKEGLIGAIILIVSHAFAKSSAFYLTGNILSVYRTRNINEVNSLLKNMPYTAYGLILAALAVTGAPPFATFVGEFIIISGVFKIYGLFYAVVIISFLLLAFLSINYKVARMSFSDDKSSQNVQCELIGASVPLVNISLSILVVFAIPLINSLLKGLI